MLASGSTPSWRDYAPEGRAYGTERIMEYPPSLKLWRTRWNNGENKNTGDRRQDERLEEWNSGMVEWWKRGAGTRRSPLRRTNVGYEGRAGQAKKGKHEKNHHRPASPNRLRRGPPASLETQKTLRVLDWIDPPSKGYGGQAGLTRLRPTGYTVASRRTQRRTF